MKNKLLISGLIILTNITLWGQCVPKKNIIIQTLDFNYLEGCETGKGNCNPIEIVRCHSQDSILLIFPNGGTESDVYLRSLTDKRFELHDKKYAAEGKPTLNLTKLQDGKYSASIISCGLGGSCEVHLKTQTE